MRDLGIPLNVARALRYRLEPSLKEQLPGYAIKVINRHGMFGGDHMSHTSTKGCLNSYTIWGTRA